MQTHRTTHNIGAQPNNQSTDTKWLLASPPSRVLSLFSPARHHATRKSLGGWVEMSCADVSQKKTPPRKGKAPAPVC